MRIQQIPTPDLKGALNLLETDPLATKHRFAIYRYVGEAALNMTHDEYLAASCDEQCFTVQEIKQELANR